MTTSITAEGLKMVNGDSMNGDTPCGHLAAEAFQIELSLAAIVSANHNTAQKEHEPCTLKGGRP